jgi:hypothetical protein
MSEEGEEGSIITEDMRKPLEKREIGPTSLDVTDDRVSIGPTSIDVTNEQALILETLPAEQREEKVQEQNKQIEQSQEKSRISKNQQKRRITSYLSNISKQVERQGNQINKVTTMIQSLQRQKQTMSTTGAGQSQFQSVKQIKSQVNQLQKQVTRIQDDVRSIRSTFVSGTGARTRIEFRKRASSTGVKPRPKKTKSHRSIQSRKQKPSVRNRN